MMNEETEHLWQMYQTKRNSAKRFIKQKITETRGPHVGTFGKFLEGQMGNKKVP